MESTTAFKPVSKVAAPALGTIRHGRGSYLGKRLDAFPSGHAIHVGALASAATVLAPAKRNLVWSVGAGLVATRIILLAHWASDVAAGLAIGALMERLLRFWTGYGSSHRKQRCVRDADTGQEPNMQAVRQP
jgi:membrane-associated phospholipid phosphatase